MSNTPIDVVFIPALLCDEAMYADVIAALGTRINAQVMLSPKPHLAASVADILARAPETFVLVGTSYGGSLALEVALAAPNRVTALWAMGCDPAAPQPGGPDLAAGLETAPEATIDMLAGLVVRADATAAAATFAAMAHRVGATAGAAQARASASRADVISRLGSLTMPALALWGKDDAIVPAAVGQTLADALPAATFVVLESCGHLPTMEKPAQSATLFSELLQRAHQLAT